MMITKPIASLAILTTTGLLIAVASRAPWQDERPTGAEELVELPEVSPALERETREHSSQKPAQNPPPMTVDNPLETYEHFIAAANAGNSDAQLFVSEALSQCAQSSVTSERQLEALESDTRVDAALKDSLRRRFSECRGLYDKLGENLQELAHAWLATSASEGNPVASLRALLLHPIEPSQDELLPTLYLALDYAQGNPMLQSITFTGVQHYFSRYLESPVEDSGFAASEFRRGADRDAWDYLACKYSPDCDVSELISVMEIYFYAREIEAMLDRASEILVAIEKSDWDALRLHDRKELGQ